MKEQVLSRDAEKLKWMLSDFPYDHSSRFEQCIDLPKRIALILYFAGATKVKHTKSNWAGYKEVEALCFQKDSIEVFPKISINEVTLKLLGKEQCGKPLLWYLLAKSGITYSGGASSEAVQAYMHGEFNGGFYKEHKGVKGKNLYYYGNSFMSDIVNHFNTFID